MKYTLAIAALLMSSNYVLAAEDEDGAAAAAQTAATGATCANSYMTEAVENEAKAKAQQKVAISLKATAVKLRDAEIAKLEPAKKALEDFEKTLTAGDVSVAAKAYTAAQRALVVPEQSHSAWKDMADAREETMMAAFKTWTSYQELWESQKATLAQFKEDKVNYEAQDGMNSTAETQQNISTVNFNIQKATDTVALLAKNVATNELRYKTAGQQFQDSDKEREIAYQKLTSAQAELDAAKKLVSDQATGSMSGQATKLKTLQAAVNDIEVLFNKLDRDVTRTYAIEILSLQKQEAAIAAYALAETSCAKLGGEDPLVLAAKIVADREKNSELIAKLNSEDAAFAAQIVTGETNFDCRQIEKWQGTTLTRPVRPLCNIGFCCGAGLNASDGFQMETCQKDGTKSVNYQPMRAANASGRKAAEKLDFSCIEGAQKIAASAVALLSAVYLLA